MNDPPFNAYHVSGLDLHAYLRAILTPEEYREVIRKVEEKTKAGSEGNWRRRLCKSRDTQNPLCIKRASARDTSTP